MTFSIVISSISHAELPIITGLLSALTPTKRSAEIDPGNDQAAHDTEESDSSSGRESTRERGLAAFVGWAQGLGLQVRRSNSTEHGTFIVGTGAKEWPVEVICSKRPRISLRKQWAEAKDLVLAYVWLEDHSVTVMPYREVESRLKRAAFTEDGFYTKALSASRKEDLLPFRKNLEISEECAVATLMETGAFCDESEAREYFRETGFPGSRR